MNTREEALEILIKVTEHGAYLNDTLRMYFRESSRERAFVTRLCTETLKRLIELDFRIGQYAKTKVKKMHPVVRNILRLSVCQLFYMDGVPPSAAVNEAVKLAKKRGQAKASGFINGILRSMQRNEKPYPYEETVPLEKQAISTAFSLPLWIVELFAGRFGMERTKEIAGNYLMPAPITLRVNTAKISARELSERFADAGIEVKELPSQTEALLLTEPRAVETLPGFAEGLFFIQDVSSMAVAASAGIGHKDTVVDVCAAPGGKALHAADLAFEGKVIARDISEKKVEKIRENIRRAGVSHVQAGVWDACKPDPNLYGKADIVIADLPCSGLGVLKRKPEIKYRLKPMDIRALADLQQKILSVICAYPKPGGRLVFSTCTLTEEENDSNTKRFLAAHPNFCLRSERTILPDAVHDGFYIAVMEKRA